MIKGVDLSSLSNVEKHGGKFYLNNKQDDCLKIIKQFDDESNSYEIGDCDLDESTKGSLIYLL